MCHVLPGAVDNLDLHDFATLIDDVDAYLKALNKS